MLVGSISSSFTQFWDKLFGWLPNLIGALVILLIGYIVARLVAGAVRRLMQAVHADRAIDNSVVGNYKRTSMPSFSVANLVARVTFWFVFGVAALLALSALQVGPLTAAIGTIVAYLPNVIAAILILLVGIGIAAGVGTIVARLAGDTMLGKMIETLVPVLVVAVAVFMALVQLKIAPAIVTATYVIVLGSIGLGAALAFGLGGREVAGRMLNQGYEVGRQRLPQMQQEAQVMGDRASGVAAQAKDQAQQTMQQGSAETQQWPASETQPPSPPHGEQERPSGEPGSERAA